ncbi:MAG: hypothetical protein RLZZ536_699 [Planctomycetota bacterium]|jgi:hypothetical protein
MMLIESLNIRVLKCLVVLMAMVCCPAGGVAADDSGEVADAIADLLSNVDRLQSETSLGYERGGRIGLLGTLLQPGESISLNRELDADTTCTVLTGSDQSDHDIDLTVFDAFGRPISLDHEPDTDALVSFTATGRGLYRLQLELCTAARPCFVFAAVLVEGGCKVGRETQESVALSLLDCLQIASEKSEGRLGFADGGNWAVYGTLLGSGEQITIDNVNLGVGERLLFAVDDGTNCDLDLFILENRSEKVVGEDTSGGPEAVLSAKFFGRDTRLRMRNVATSPEPTFALLGILSADAD